MLHKGISSVTFKSLMNRFKATKMSNGLITTIGTSGSDGFTVKAMCGCRLVFGSVPISELTMLTHGFSNKAMMAVDIADLIGASFVIGEPKDLEELRKQDLPVSERRHSDYMAVKDLGLDAVAMWLRNGERGTSSDGMCKQIFGVPTRARIEHPLDPDDLRRCVLFLDATDAHDKVPLMASVSPTWGRLVLAWSELVESLRSEIRMGKSAPKTYALMKRAIEAKQGEFK